MLFYCSHMCRSIIFPSIFDSFYWGILIYFRSWNLFDVVHSYTVARVHPLPVSWYLISLVCVYRCSWMHIMSVLCSRAYAISSGSWPILFKVLKLNYAICIVCLHFSSFCCLSSVADFSNTEARAPTSAGRAPFLLARRAMRFVYVVWVWVMVIFRWLFLFSSIKATLIDKQQ